MEGKRPPPLRPSTPSSLNPIDRRGFLALGVTAGAGLLGTAMPEPAEAGVPMRRLPPLPTNDLPEKVFNTAGYGISRKTHEAHFAIYERYVAMANALRDRLGHVANPAQSDPVYSDIREIKIGYANAVNAVRSHELFFNSLGGKQLDVEGNVSEALATGFGSFANWQTDMRATALAARAWAWLAIDHVDGMMQNYLGDDEHSFPIWQATPILAIDMSEHAYYLDFANDRARYLDAIFDVIDWPAVSVNLKAAKATATAAKDAR
jgi:Fe-Mn family superoxide dismutase